MIIDVKSDRIEMGVVTGGKEVRREGLDLDVFVHTGIVDLSLIS